jgi:hypothetical protein
MLKKGRPAFEILLAQKIESRNDVQAQAREAL